MSDEKIFEYGGYWLSKRRDGASPEIWQITRYAPKSRSHIYKSTRCKSLDDAKDVLVQHVEMERAKQEQPITEALVVPILMTYWHEKGKKSINRDQTARSLRTFIGFLEQDEVTGAAVASDLRPALFERFREWRMGPHQFITYWGGPESHYQSNGVSGDTVNRNLNDVRAAINHAADNMRIPLAPKVPAIDERYLNPLRERILTEEELARIFWYARHFPEMFRFVTLQMVTSVRPDAAKKFNPLTQFDAHFGLIDLQPDAAPRTKKRNAIIPAIRPMRVVLTAWQKDGYRPVTSNKTSWRTLRRALDLSDDVFPKTIRHTIATWLYNDRTVPERQISEMLGHAGELRTTSKLYVKYRTDYLGDVTTALTRIWLRISRLAKQYSADHVLTRQGKGAILAIDRSSLKGKDLCGFSDGGRGKD